MEAKVIALLVGAIIVALRIIEELIKFMIKKAFNINPNNSRNNPLSKNQDYQLRRVYEILSHDFPEMKEEIQKHTLLLEQILKKLERICD
jgi:hypothetical protein